MRAVIQRVSKASVTGMLLNKEREFLLEPVDENVVSSISKGLCVLVGLKCDDTEEDATFIANKILNLRIFSDEISDKPWMKSVKDLQLEVLSVSQFTLFASTKKGSKPDFHNAMKGSEAKDLYEKFLAMLKNGYSEDKISDGVFGAKMEIGIFNDGPVTIILDSKDRK